MCQDTGIEIGDKYGQAVAVDPDASCGLWVTEAGAYALVEAKIEELRYRPEPEPQVQQECTDGVHCLPQERVDGQRSKLLERLAVAARRIPRLEWLETVVIAAERLAMPPEVTVIHDLAEAGVELGPGPGVRVIGLVKEAGDGGQGDTCGAPAAEK